MKRRLLSLLPLLLLLAAIAWIDHRFAPNGYGPRIHHQHVQQLKNGGAAISKVEGR